jgi:hypothetical protein
LQSGWDSGAADKCARLLARIKNGGGDMVAGGAREVAAQIRLALERQSARFLLETALAADGFADAARLASGPLARAGLAGHSGATRISVGLDLSLVGLGAPAPVYYPSVARILGADALIPDHADVANAIGAVVGEVRYAAEIQITCPAEGLFRLHGPDGPQDVRDERKALEAAGQMAKQIVWQQAREAGVHDPSLVLNEEIQAAEVEAQRTVLGARVRATAAGRPAMGGRA